MNVMTTAVTNFGNDLVTGDLAVNGAISAGGSVTGTTGLTATTGNIIAQSGSISAAGTGANGKISASGTVTGGTGLIATTGGVTASAGNIDATAGTVTGGTGLIATTGGVTATNGNIVASAGNIVATAGTVTGGTGLIATTGGVTASAGNIVASAGTVTGASLASTYGGVTLSGTLPNIYFITGSTTWNIVPTYNSLIFNNNSSPATPVYFSTAGYVYGTAFTPVSDYRLKSNIAPLKDSLSIIQALRPVNYTLNVDPSNIESGFIAHELQEVLPGAVKGVKDGPAMQAINPVHIIAHLVGAVQELTKRLEQLSG